MSRPKLFQVVPTDDFKVYLYYDNGEIKLYNCNWILGEKGIFETIHDNTIFKELYTIMNGTLTRLNELLSLSGKMYSHWTGAQETALYFYGESFAEMHDKMAAFLTEYPLCQKCRVEKIA